MNKKLPKESSTRSFLPAFQLYRNGVVAALICVAAALPSYASEADPSETVAVETAATELPAAETDSSTVAFATIMASQLGQDIARRFPDNPDAMEQFAAGVAEAFRIARGADPYYLGVRHGFSIEDRLSSMNQLGFNMTPEAFNAAFIEALKSNTMFTVESADEYLRKMIHRLNGEPEAPQLTPESQALFLEEQKARPGVVQTPSGLLFEVLTEGEGSSPTDSDKVRVVYTGQLSDGTVFDSTETPIEFPVNRLVPGFSEGLKMMKPGGKYRIIIPSELGYGETGAAGVIPPGAALDFTIDLREVVPGDR